MILNIKIKEKKLDEVRLIPCEIQDFRPVIVNDEQKAGLLLKKMRSLSFNVDIDKNGIVKQK